MSADLYPPPRPFARAARVFLSHVVEARRKHGVPADANLVAGQIFSGSLALLFPHFASGNRDDAELVAEEAELVRAELVEFLHKVGRDRTHAEPLADGYLDRLGFVGEALMEDARAIADADPAARTIDEVILAYPGFLAIASYRIARLLLEIDVPLLPRLITEAAHRSTGIDIHPGAILGRSLAIDHGTGIVIGETAEVGDRVRLYQGVTLGALSVRKDKAGRKRHPTIESDVTIYANATILGGDTVVGARSIIGGNVWLTHSVPAGSIVTCTDAIERQAPPDGSALEYHI